MTGQSRRLRQVPYGRRKLKLRKKTISLKFYLLLGFLRYIPQTFRKCSLKCLENPVENFFKNQKNKVLRKIINKTF